MSLALEYEVLKFVLQFFASRQVPVRLIMSGSGVGCQQAAG
jgi:hypothetical protein